MMNNTIRERGGTDLPWFRISDLKISIGAWDPGLIPQLLLQLQQHISTAEQSQSLAAQWLARCEREGLTAQEHAAGQISEQTSDPASELAVLATAYETSQAALAGLQGQVLQLEQEYRQQQLQHHINQHMQMNHKYQQPILKLDRKLIPYQLPNHQ